MHATYLSAPRARAAVPGRVHAAVPGRIPRMLTAVLGPLAALGLLLCLQGCGTTAAATTSVTGPTPAAALRVFTRTPPRSGSRWPTTTNCWPCRC